MKKLIVLLIIAAGLLFISANSRDSDRQRHEYATVDTDPGASGYFTNNVSPRRQGGAVFFSVRDVSSMSMTVTLQFQCDGDAAWTDYETYTAVTRVKISDNGGKVLWRAGVKESADYTSGESTFGFDW